MPFTGSPDEITLLQKAFEQAEAAYKKSYGVTYSASKKSTVEELIQDRLGRLKKVAEAIEEAALDPSNSTKAATAQNRSDGLATSLQVINSMMKPKSKEKDWDTKAVYDPFPARPPRMPFTDEAPKAASRNIVSSPPPLPPIVPPVDSHTVIQSSTPTTSSEISPSAAFKATFQATKTPDLSSEKGCQEAFHAKHKELYERGGIFKRTTVKPTDNLNKIIGYAVDNDNSRSRQALIELGWWDKKTGTLAEAAPGPVKAALEQIAAEKENTNKGMK